MSSRREFVATAARVASLSLLPNPFRNLLATRQATATTFRWETISPAARVAFGVGGNSLVVIRGSEALLIDTKVAAFGQVLEREVRGFGATIRSVITRITTTTTPAVTMRSRRGRSRASDRSRRAPAATRLFQPGA